MFPKKAEYLRHDFSIPLASYNLDSGKFLIIESAVEIRKSLLY